MRECPRCDRCYEDEVQLCPDDQSNTRLTLPGTTLLNARYRLEKRTGRFVLGQVYLASDETRRKSVAVKTIRPNVFLDQELDEGEANALFEREAVAAASLYHPNIIAVTDFGKSEHGVFFLVTEYFEGELLHRLLQREGTLSVQRAVTLLRQAGAGVEAAHDEGILHGDLTPANILIVEKKLKGAARAGDDLVKVADFGTTRRLSQSPTDSRSHVILGTPEYLAPEQTQADTVLDERADVYALGAIAYHMLAGRPPFTGDTVQIIMGKLTQEAPPLSSLRSDVSPDLEKSVMHALEREPAARPPSVAAWFAEFDAAVDSFQLEEDAEGTRLLVMAPKGAEVYVDDEHHGRIGPSGKIILTSIPPGPHVLRVNHAGDSDDERVIEIRAGKDEQIIHAQFKPEPSIGSSSSESPAIAWTAPRSVEVLCPTCGSVCSSGTKFCGRCGKTISRSTGELAPLIGRLCYGCGARSKPGEIFCSRCGYRLDSADANTGQLAPPDKGNWIESASLQQPFIPPSPQSIEPSAPAPRVRASSGAHAASRPSLLARAREGVRTLLDGLKSPSAAETLVRTEPSPVSDEVRCSVFAPSYAKQGQQFLLQVFAHLPEQAKAAEGLATEFDETSHRRGLRTLEGKVERGSKLTFQLTAPGLIIAEDVQSLIWRASPEPEAVQFRVQVPPDQPTEPIIGTVTVSHQTVPIGHITFKLLIVTRDFAAGDAPTREERPWVPYKKAFISYASQDRKEVLKRVQMLDLEGIKFFQDALQMEPGQRWERRLYREIDQCDVFYLFWSTAAKESKWVMQEVQYALERKGNNESAPPAIIPVIIEGPPPVPPPAELAHLHFDHYMIYFMV